MNLLAVMINWRGLEQASNFTRVEININVIKPRARGQSRDGHDIACQHKCKSAMAHLQHVKYINTYHISDK